MLGKNCSLYKEWNNEFYVVMNLIDAREVTFTNPIELKLSVELTADIHKYGTDIIRELYLKNNNKIKLLLDKSLINNYTENINNIELIYSNVIKYKYRNEFDEIFLKNANNSVVGAITNCPKDPKMEIINYRSRMKNRRRGD